MKVKCTEILWDDGAVDLPKECVLDLDDRDRTLLLDLGYLEYRVANLLSDKYGWGVFRCNYEVVESQPSLKGIAE